MTYLVDRHDRGALGDIDDLYHLDYLGKYDTRDLYNLEYVGELDGLVDGTPWKTWVTKSR